MIFYLLQIEQDALLKCYQGVNVIECYLPSYLVILKTFQYNVVTQVLVFEDKGKISEYVGGYSDWYNKFGKNLLLAKDKNKLKNKPEQKKDNTNNTTQIKTKNSQKQIDHVLKQIDKLEKKASELEVEIAKPDFYNQEQQLVKKKLKKLDDVNNELSVLYLQWNELE